jgi:hypothetical protein
MKAIELSMETSMTIKQMKQQEEEKEREEEEKQLLAANHRIHTSH